MGLLIRSDALLLLDQLKQWLSTTIKVFEICRGNGNDGNNFSNSCFQDYTYTNMA